MYKQLLIAVEPAKSDKGHLRLPKRSRLRRL